ncbi:hypothetical protein DL766_001674 [Monosporascus sp. MC13-8B]|nr:hypothetical protein DL766_001674 [Monosporascus sp. MC13-8B]
MPFTAGENNLLRMNGEDFDFNIQFEQLFFSIIPSVLFIITSLWRIISQARKPAVVNAPCFQLVKLGAIIFYVGLELSLLILLVIGSFRVTSFSITSSALKLMAALFMITLSIVDHSRSPRPSVLLNGYLFLTLLLDIAQARTLFLLSEDKPERTYSSIFCASIALKVGILLLEAQQKSKWITWDEKEHSPEETITETFLKATEARIGTNDHSAALTLMSTDIERIKQGLRMVHDVWAGIIQVALAGWMLYIRLGAVFVVPIGIIIVCFTRLGILINFTGDSQRAWVAGVQKRVGLTATVISSMKNLKISGLSSTVGDFVQMFRVEELAAGARFRKIFILAALLGFASMLISPPLTFAFTRETLDTTTVFTSLSFLMLLTNPLSQIFQAIPELVSGLACIGRIQSFLECESRHDFRRVLVDQREKVDEVGMDTEASSGTEFDPVDPVIVIKNGKFSWEADKSALQNVNTRIMKSSLTMVVGPVGSGKSSLCKALIGEIPFSEGSVAISAHIPYVGFCDQTAFFWNGTIRDNIIGFSPFDDQRYTEVIKATALSFDFAEFPQGDKTNIGSNGITLSGGQKQRISLARALYLQTDLLTLDDIFSGLDTDTEHKVFRQVFGPNGLLKQRRSTAVLCTHSVKYLPAADYVIALGDGSIIEQGTFDSLIARQGYVGRLGMDGSSDIDVISQETTSTTSTAGSQLQVSSMTAASPLIVTEDADPSRRFGGKRVFRQYFKSMGWQLRLLDLETKSPLYTHFLDTLRGIATLRAFGFVSEVVSKNAGLLNSSQRPAYLLPMVQEWLNLVLALVVMVLATVLTTLAVRLHSSSGFAGASLVTLMAFGENLSGIVIYYTRLETSIGAIARLKNFNETVKPEDRDNEDALPPDADSGTNSISSLALRDIHLTIKSGEKIAICGRTGSGKSSLISLLLKILDPLPGTAENAVIDGIPLYRLDRSALRQHIIAVPQEAVFLPDGSTFQTNLDPSGVSTRGECQAILSAVGLWEFVQERGGLDAGMSAGTLSAGQRQHMSLGRAVLRRRIRGQKSGSNGSSSGILLLDEVNSSVDHDTERAMQDIIRTEFEGYTVIAISHRLDMIMDFDRVIVMDKGKIVEVGNPVMLSNMAGTRFGSLAKAGSK